MKKTLLLLTTIILAFSLSACNLFGPTPDEVATDFLTSVQKGEWEEASEYVNTDESKEKIKEFTTSDEDVKYIEDLIGKMSFTIGTVKEEDNKATVQSEIETVDMKIIIGTIFQEMLAEAFAQAFSGEETDEEAQDEEMTKLLVEGMNEPSAKKVTNKVNIQLVKVDGDWKVEVSDELLNALTGGLSSMGEEMEGTELNPFGQ
jgi:predicted small lipoprotein YifL